MVSHQEVRQGEAPNGGDLKVSFEFAEIAKKTARNVAMRRKQLAVKQHNELF